MAKLAAPPAASFLRPQWLIVAVLLALLSLTTPQQLLQQLALPASNQPPSALKPYADLRAFRPR